MTLDGELAPFRRGIERIVAATPVPVLPMTLNGLWGSRFSRQREGRKPLGKLWSRVTLRVGNALAPSEVSAERVEREVRALLGERAIATSVAATRAADKIAQLVRRTHFEIGWQ